MRGSLYGPGDYQVSRDLGMTILPWLELRELGPEAYGDLVRRRVARARRTSRSTSISSTRRSARARDAGGRRPELG